MLFDELKDRPIYGAADLAKVANSILKQVGMTQERGAVSEYLEARTVRYYLSTGLIPASDDKQGLNSVFGYRHLLAILLIKQLQSEHFSNRKIREIMDGKSELELERLLRTGAGAVESTREAWPFIEGLGKTSNSPRELISSHALRDENIATQRPPRVLSKISHSALPSGMRSTNWQRIEICKGLELSINDDFRLPQDPGRSDEIVNEIKKLLESRRFTGGQEIK